MKREKPSRRRKMLIIGTICLATVAGGALLHNGHEVKTSKETVAIQEEQWVAYSPKNARFRVQFPSKPTEGAQILTIQNRKIPYYQFSAEEQGAEYVVSYMDFPGIWKLLGTNKMLSKSFSSMVKKEPNIEEVYEHELKRYRGYPALSYKIQQNGKELWGRFIIVGNTLYRLTVAKASDAKEPFNPEVFLNSFIVHK